MLRNLFWAFNWKKANFFVCFVCFRFMMSEVCFSFFSCFPPCLFPPSTLLWFWFLLLPFSIFCFLFVFLCLFVFAP